MLNDLILFRNELKNKSVAKYKFIGIVTELIFSKEVFSTNLDVKDFIEKIFDFKYSKNVLESRSKILIKVLNDLNDCTDCSIYVTNLYVFVDKKINAFKIRENKSKLSNWIKQ